MFCRGVASITLPCSLDLQAVRKGKPRHLSHLLFCLTSLPDQIGSQMDMMENVSPNSLISWNSFFTQRSSCLAAIIALDTFLITHNRGQATSAAVCQQSQPLCFIVRGCNIVSRPLTVFMTSPYLNDGLHSSIRRAPPHLIDKVCHSGILVCYKVVLWES